MTMCFEPTGRAPALGVVVTIVTSTASLPQWVVKCMPSPRRRDSADRNCTSQRLLGYVLDMRLLLGMGWSGVFFVWRLAEFTGVDFCPESIAVGRRHIIPTLVKYLVMVEEGIMFVSRLSMRG